MGVTKWPTKACTIPLLTTTTATLTLIALALALPRVMIGGQGRGCTTTHLIHCRWGRLHQRRLCLSSQDNGTEEDDCVNR